MDLDTRKQHWEREYPGLRNWKIEGVHPTKSIAQEAETRLAHFKDCVSSHGGDGPEYATWSVYSFDF